MIDAGIIDRFHDHGWAVLPDVIDPATVAAALDALDRAAASSEAAGIPTRMEALDPGGANVRVYDLVAHDPIFADLAEHPAVLPYVSNLLDNDVMLSNFTANTALPGSGSMNPHCDQSTIMPEPWLGHHAMNAIWCLHDTDEANGATRYLPGSHRFLGFDDVPEDPRVGMESFSAAAGSVILMHGRLWHTSGENRTTHRRRSLLFAFYTRSYLRLQTNWWQCIPAERRPALSPTLRQLLGFAGGNMMHGAYLAT